jgi:hypothetical protein
MGDHGDSLVAAAGGGALVSGSGGSAMIFGDNRPERDTASMSHYEEVPREQAEKIIAAAEKNKNKEQEA